MSEEGNPRETILIHTPYIRLDQMLKFCGEAMSGAEAKAKIQQEEIRVNGEVCVERGKKLKEGDLVVVSNKRTYLIDYEIERNKD